MLAASNSKMLIKMSLSIWWLQHRDFQLMLKLSPASLQTFIDTPHYLAQFDCLAADLQGQGDTRLTLTPSVIPNSNYVIMVSDWNCLKYFCIVIIRCIETFWSPCILCLQNNNFQTFITTNIFMPCSPYIFDVAKITLKIRSFNCVG
jgi:hypothetical protein